MLRNLSMYCVAKRPTPLLNTPDFQHVFGGKTLPLDDQGLLRPVEMIALPETFFEILSQHPNHILEVVTDAYPSGSYFLDARFVKPEKMKPKKRCPALPKIEILCTRLQNAIGLPYIWGGNWGKGIPEIQELYQPNIPPEWEKIWTLSGVDCSGLLYEATNGYTPRNTSELLKFGEHVSSIQNVKPLDILVWPGHVIIVVSSDLVIESLYGKGVITTSLSSRLSQLSSVDFVIRRFV